MHLCHNYFHEQDMKQPQPALVIKSFYEIYFIFCTQQKAPTLKL